MNDSEVAPRILVADDNPDVRAMLVELLTLHGADVVAVEDGEAAVRESICGAFDLCILDIDMPKMNGLEACPKIIALGCTRNMPVLFITGNSDADSIRCAFDAGASDFLPKPIHPILLWRRISNLLLLSKIGRERDNLSALMKIADVPPIE